MLELAKEYCTSKVSIALGRRSVGHVLESDITVESSAGVEPLARERILNESDDGGAAYLCKWQASRGSRSGL